MTKTEIQEKIDVLKKSIQESEENIADMESQIEDLETELEWERGDLSDMESQLEYYTKKLLTLQTPQEQLPYWLNFIHDSTRKELDGQFERNDRWYVCNGLVLLELNKKLDCLKECEGQDSLPKLFEKQKEKIEFNIESISNDELLGENVNIVPNLTVLGTYLLAVKNILQLDNGSKYYSAKGIAANEKVLSLFCENDNGRALILGRVVYE